jgi:hypothetical protein
MDWNDLSPEEMRQIVQPMFDEVALAEALDEADWPEMGRHVATADELAELKAMLRSWQERHGLCPSCTGDVYNQAVELFTDAEDTLCLRREWR